MIFEQLNDFTTALAPEHRLLGLDIGESSIGIALSDINQFIASPLDILNRENISKDTGRIRTLIKKYEVSGLVVGLPRLMSGDEGDSCQMVRHFIKKLASKTELPFFLQDERMSTQAVERILDESTITRKRKNAVDDKLAATYILQSTLDVIKKQ